MFTSISAVRIVVNDSFLIGSDARTYRSTGPVFYFVVTTNSNKESNVFLGAVAIKIVKPTLRIQILFLRIYFIDNTVFRNRFTIFFIFVVAKAAACTT